MKQRCSFQKDIKDQEADDPATSTVAALASPVETAMQDDVVEECEEPGEDTIEDILYESAQYVALEETEICPFPHPPIPNLLDCLHPSNIYTKINLQASNLICVPPSDDEMKAASDFKVEYFGLTKAPATFQWFMNKMFAKGLDKFVLIYLDDILIFSNPEEHVEKVREVLSRLRKYRLFADAEKCEWSVNTIEFLGFVVSPSGLSMAQSKVDAILNWPTPQTVKQLQSFLGFANFYQRSIFNYSDIVVPLTRLTRKGAHWNWSNEADAAFHALKQAAASPPAH